MGLAGTRVAAGLAFEVESKFLPLVARCLLVKVHLDWTPRIQCSAFEPTSTAEAGNVGALRECALTGAHPA